MVPSDDCYVHVLSSRFAFAALTCQTPVTGDGETVINVSCKPNALDRENTIAPPAILHDKGSPKYPGIYLWSLFPPGFSVMQSLFRVGYVNASRKEKLLRRYLKPLQKQRSRSRYILSQYESDIATIRRRLLFEKQMLRSLWFMSLILLVAMALRRL